MPIQAATVYPMTTAFSGSGQLDEGPFNIPFVNSLLRLETHGQVNFAADAIIPTGVEANQQLWGVQWVLAGAGPQNVITSADGPQWLMRQQIHSGGTVGVWTPTTADANHIHTYPLQDEWAGQRHIGASIDIYLSLAPPSGVLVGNLNLFGSLRFWWS